MNSVIYYFSGTGNSLWVAKQIGQSIEGTKLIPISTVMDQETIEFKEEYIGIVTPVYYNGLPMMVKRFLKKVKVSNHPYIYSFATLGEKSSNVFTEIDTLLNGNLSYGRHITMPGNYLRMFNTPSDDVIKEQLSNGQKVIEDSIIKIKEKKSEPYVKEMILKRFVYSPVRNIWINKLPKIDQSFNVDSKCISCNICKKVCPVKNIEMVDQKPKWQGMCEDCMACIHLCPAKAIQIKNKTKNKKRYINPEIKIEELMINK